MSTDNRLPDRDELNRFYSKRVPYYEKVLIGVAKDIKDSLLVKGLNPTIKYRVKSFESYFNKLIRRMKQNRGSCIPEEITDILGARIIFPFLEDIETAEKIIRSSFSVTGSEKKGVNHSFREFGYEATHLMLRIEKYIPEEAGLDVVPCCEIQLSTILQDAWSEVEHELVYKAEFTPFDLPLKRKLAALNANLTLADIIFQEIRDYHRAMQLELKKRRSALYEKIGIPGTIAGTEPVSGTTVEQETAPAQSDSMPEDTIDNILLKAITAHNEGLYPRAISLYSRLLGTENLPSVKSIIHNHRGMAYLAQARYGEAIDDFSEAVKLDAFNFRAYNYRGFCRRMIGEHGTAIDDFNTSITVNPYQSESYYSRALAWYELGDIARAFEDCNRALNLKPESSSIRSFFEMVRKKMFE
ncbi:MAG TPA: tetratricopeptide repeat protein [Spirochaetota bacterium]|nr:tetratricopeptide repeat protein [Spirochaetota bacterium]